MRVWCACCFITASLRVFGLAVTVLIKFYYYYYYLASIGLNSAKFGIRLRNSLITSKMDNRLVLTITPNSESSRTMFSLGSLRESVSHMDLTCIEVMVYKVLIFDQDNGSCKIIIIN